MSVEFKQIIGRGTRLFDGKDHFTICDFDRACEHFNDPDWDGEPVDPEPCSKCGSYPCQCEIPTPRSCPFCGMNPCVCDAESAGAGYLDECRPLNPASQNR